MVDKKVDRVGYYKGIETTFHLNPSQLKKWDRSRPRQHERSGSATSKGYRSPSVVNVGLSIKQVGAIPLRHRNHTYYELSGGLFTKKQILESRRRIGEVKYNQRVSKKQVGL
jgi:hypothetical protein